MARPRDPDVEDRILGAARHIADTDGIDRVTIAAVARLAGVGRPTVYRRWPTRAALLFELQLAGTVPPTLPDLGSFRADLIAALTHLHAVLGLFDREVHAEQMAAMISDRSFAESVWAQRWIPDRERILQLWERAVDRGEVDPSVDGRALVDDLVAATVFRLLLWHDEDPSWIEPLVDRFRLGAEPRS